VTSVLARDEVVLICWEHDNIMPNIMGAINERVPISNYSSIPSPFPDGFYLVWVLDLNHDGKSYTWIGGNQRRSSPPGFSCDIIGAAGASNGHPPGTTGLAAHTKSKSIERTDKCF
jgi:hypothetical protein